MAESINMRKAVAGINLLKGMSQKQALMNAGYAENSARTPQKNGIHAEACLSEARKLDPDLEPAKIVERARRMLSGKIDSYLDGKAGQNALKASRASEIARLFEVTEKYLGDQAGGEDISARSFVDRVEWLREVMRETENRKHTQDVVVSQLEAGDNAPLSTTK